MLAFGGATRRQRMPAVQLEGRPDCYEAREHGSAASSGGRGRAEAVAPLQHSNPSRPFLQIPPFPGSAPKRFAEQRDRLAEFADIEVDELIEDIRSARIGGEYWGDQPSIPEQPYLLVRIADAEQRYRELSRIDSGKPVVVWLDGGADRDSSSVNAAKVVCGACDPWHLLGGSLEAIMDADDELALIAAIAGVPTTLVGRGRFADLGRFPSRAAVRRAFRDHVLGACDYFDPYTGEPISFAQAIDRCRFWRRMVDSNRDIGAAVGFAFWKRSTVAPLLWRGSPGTAFHSRVSALRASAQVAVWKSRTSASTLAQLERKGAHLVEVEDGFVRSAGLGADCVPPLSILVDRKAAHFDASRPSELEDLLQNGVFSPPLLARARELRRLIVDSGVSKYDTGRGLLERRIGNKRHVLVPGQVEDDRAVVLGGGPTSNLELLRRVRSAAPDAYIMYKPHPDVEAGHRAGEIPDDVALSVADEIVRDAPIAALLDLADEVHVNTSLAGFEALMRDKPVTTHGVPFYAGWGLTRDLGPVPSRRTATRTIDELVAAALLLYPRYLDPVTGLPCPAEVLVRRLADGQSNRRDGIIVRLRKFQGRCRRGLAGLRNRR